MRRLFGILLLLIGWGFASWAALVGLSFCSVFLIGFIGTGGREGGSELLLYLGYALIAVTAGYLVGLFGKKLLKKEDAKDLP